jgi:hypothetical protein
MTNPSEMRSGENGWAWVSWLACVLALGCVAYAMAWFPTVGDEFKSIFKDFHLELPLLTQLALRIPHAAYFIVGTLLAIAVIGVQWKAPSRNTAASFHFLTIILCFIAYLLYQRAMLEPMIYLMQSMSSQSGGGR